MEKTKIEEFCTAMGYLCEITIRQEEVEVFLYKKGDVFIKSHRARTLKQAIDKAVKSKRIEYAKKPNNSGLTNIQKQEELRRIHKGAFGKK